VSIDKSDPPVLDPNAGYGPPRLAGRDSSEADGGRSGGVGAAWRLFRRPKPEPSSGDRELVAGCLQGDEHAWAALIEKYRRLIYSIPLRYGGTPEDAADIFQNVCLELFNELPRLRNTDTIRPWLATVAAHQAFHWKRRRESRSRREVEGVDIERIPEPVPSVVIREVERKQLIREAIEALSSRCREMIQMLFYTEPAVPYAEVAVRLGLAVGSIGSIRDRCLRHLQRALERLGF
jgi:RNA polymerase sigma factor (sigma-70 family)